MVQEAASADRSIVMRFRVGELGLSGGVQRRQNKTLCVKNGRLFVKINLS